MTVIKTKRIVVSANGDEYENRTAFLRHEHQARLGKARTRIKIKRADEPLIRSPDA